MTVDHLKMLHTAGGKGKVPCLTVGQQPCGEAAERGARSLALSVLWECLEKVDGTLLCFVRNLGLFFYLRRFAASLALKHFTVLAPGCSRGERLQVSLAICQHCDVNRLLATCKTKFSLLPNVYFSNFLKVQNRNQKKNTG